MSEIGKSIANGFGNWIDQFKEIDYGIYINRLIYLIIILIVSNLIIRIGKYLIKGFFKHQQKIRFSMNERKANTLSTIVQSLLRYTVYFFALASILSVFNLSGTASSLLATAGIGGLAIGFGAQNLIKDIITGFFILFEDQFAVGDFVTVVDITGTVEEIGLRVTHIRGFKGDLNIIPNGSITKVTNYTRGNVLAVLDVGIAYEADIDKAVSIMERVGKELFDESTDMVEQPQVLGVMGLNESEVALRMIAKTLPMKHWAIERELRKRIKENFDREGVEIPYPRRVVISRQENGRESVE